MKNINISTPCENYKLLHFQDYNITNMAYSDEPLTFKNFISSDIISVVVLRDPFEYFDYMVTEYIKQKKSRLFSNLIEKKLKESNPDIFLNWLDTLNIIPFYNPQTFYLDVKKRITFAKESLESFEYVVPYNFLDAFVTKTECPIDIKKKNIQKLFHLKNVKEKKLVEKFIGKDMVLYNDALVLWQKIESSGYKPLSQLIPRLSDTIPMEECDDFHGVCGGLNHRMIRGYIFSKNSTDPLNITVYRNKTPLITVKADQPRPELQKKFGLSSPKCGFFIQFDKDTFYPEDRIDIIVENYNISLPLIGDAKRFLEN